MTADEEAERFLEADLSDLDFSQFKRDHFEFDAKDAQITMRMPRSLLEAVKSQAKARGIPYQRRRTRRQVHHRRINWYVPL